MKWLIDLIAKLTPNLIKELIGKKSPSMEVGEAGGEFEEKVKEQIDDQIPDGPGESK